MQMPKHSDEAKSHFRTLVPEAPGVEVDEAGLEELRALPGAGPFGPTEATKKSAGSRD